MHVVRRYAVGRSLAKILGTLIITGAFACGREGAGVSRTAGPISAHLDTTNGVRTASIVVTGLSSEELKVARESKGDSVWRALLRVSVSGASDTPVLGKYSVNDSAVVFAPQYSFDAGRLYDVSVHARSVSGTRADSVVQFTVALPSGNQTAKTSVVRILPSSTVLPENLLRLYIEFSGPMSRTGGLEFMKLLDDKGREVKAAFLPLDADFWDHTHTRYTAFLDPGRVKRGILPNEQMGRALIAGRKYSIVIDSAWRDEHGLPLVASYKREFTVTPPEERRVDYTQWKFNAPKAGSRDTLVVTFERPLDHGLLKRALGVQAITGAQILGIAEIARDETEWRFVPDKAWQSGDHNLVIFAMLEDAAGNRVDGAFEVDMLKEVDKAGKQEQYLRRFTIVPR